MAVNPSAHLAPPRTSLPSSSSSRLALFNRTSLRPAFINERIAPRILSSVRSQKPGQDAVGSMKSVADSESPIRSSSGSSASSAIDFLTLGHRLKTIKRKGWINHGIKGPESIADHMYRMAIMALIAGDLPGVNRERLNFVNLVSAADQHRPSRDHVIKF